ncbi:MAG: single-stranded-DNA-specific exonuclease RecJ [Spirochaetes bacterium GWF1_51_8]|nr:MAG: single-stranded-DNA-specific exonuclease RecJ [Spirochaetes bacterium GWF1_51_8]
MKEYDWKMRTSRKETITLLKQSLVLPDFIVNVLANRGIETYLDAMEYLYPNFLNLHNPFIFRDIHKAIFKIEETIKNKKGILVFGDRDVDGVTATAIIYKLLDKLGAQVTYRIPEGYESYGLSKDAVEWAAMNEISLLITVDCGITALKEVELANKLGLTVIITDHHEPRDTIPEAYAVINPKIAEDPYPFRSLCGAGVALKLAWAALEKKELPEYFDKELVVLDLETTGLNPHYDDIIEIGAVMLKNGIVTARFQKLIKTAKTITPEITKITGIDAGMLTDGVSIETALKELLEFIGDRKIIGHNLIDFDLKFLQHHLKKASLPQIVNPMEDTLKMSKVMLRKAKDHQLLTIANYLGFYPDPAKMHRSIADCEVCAEVYRRLLLTRNTRFVDTISEFLPLAAIGTVADIMPLTGENRNIVKNGLKLFAHAPTGLISLLRETQLPLEKITSKQVGWNIAPLLNSPGRMGTGSLSAELLISNKVNEGETLAKDIVKKDVQRKNLLKTSEEFIKNSFIENNRHADKILILASEKIPKGITGLLANKIAHEYQKPAIIISMENGEYTGSMRVSGEFEVVKMLENMSEYFTQYGGHKYAGGFTLITEKVEEFIAKANEYVSIHENDVLKEEILIDSVMSDFSEINQNNIRYLENTLEPVGHSNEFPNYLFENVKITDTYYMGKENDHALLTLKKNESTIRMVAWNAAKTVLQLLKEYTLFDIIAYPEVNTYNGVSEARLVFTDIRGKK